MRGVVRGVREAVLGAYAHQELPFERLVEELQPERDLSRNPLFQVLFTMQSSPEATAGQETAGLDMQVDTGTSKFDLLLLLAEKGEGLKGLCEYSTDLFDIATVDRMLGHYLHLLEEVTAKPDQSIETLSLLTDAQTHQLLVEFNATQADYPRETSVHQLFEAQAERTPDASAVVSDDSTFSYRELNAHANRLAHRLRALGVGAETCVGLCVERSSDMIVGVLGILKAGGAYVPLDAAYPRERLAFMLEKAAVGVLLTQTGLTDALPRCDARVVLLDDEELRRQSTNNLETVVLPDNLAYVIFTSGSTGRPKGVAMRHGALANLIRWHLNHLTLSQAARTLQFASLSFDVSFQDIFSTICSGGTLALIPEEGRRDVRQLSRRLAEQNIERVFIPPVILQQLAEVSADGEALPATLKQVVVAGERLVITPRVVDLFDRLKGCVLHNHYGPTETHVVTEHVLTGEAGGWPPHPPIGRPIANAQAYILDHNFQPLPVGVPGELYLAGEALARGYVNAPELTAERFVPHPFASAPGSRLYKTGDLARYSPEGRIEFLGRLDHQVKLRGYRIEPGEIEAVMREHAAVKEAVALLREDTPARPRLVAYVVPEGVGDGDALAAGELSGFLRERLPDYMIPSTFVVLKSLPLSPNGKVDTRALPAPDAEQMRPDAAFVEPRNSVEAEMAQIWSEVLGVSKIGVHDNFFELGGHSLLATQVVSRIREVFGVEMEVRRIFEMPTVAGLAATIIDVMAVRTDSELASELLAEIEQLTPEEARLLLSEEAG
jgi:amino acid adenylation domain-containing protein